MENEIVLEDFIVQCMDCKKIKQEGDTWVDLPNWEVVLKGREISHGLCEPCFDIRYADYVEDKINDSI